MSGSSCLTSWTRSACSRSVYHYTLSQSLDPSLNVFLLFIDKERTNLATPRGAQIWSKKQKQKKKVTSVAEILTEPLYRACKKPNLAHFKCFQANLYIFPRGPPHKKTTAWAIPHIAMVAGRGFIAADPNADVTLVLGTAACPPPHPPHPSACQDSFH